MSRSIKAGTTDVSVVIRIVDSGDGTPETGVTSATSGLDLEYRREGAASTDITESDLSALTDAHSDGGMLHIGNGYYRLDLPDAACAAGATGVLVHGTATGMVVIGEYIELVAYDPYDTVRLGLTALPNAAADAAGGLPISDAGGLDLDDLKADVTAILADTGTDGVVVASINANAITAAAIANGAIDAATFAADVDAEILSYLVDDATRIDASALNTATGTTIPAILDDTDLIDDGTSGLAKIATDVAAILVDTGTTLQAELDGIQADTEDIQSRLPAALVNSRMDCTIDGSGMESGAVAAIVAGTGLVIASGTIGATGNDTTHLHLTGLTFGDDELNDYLILVRDVSASENHARWISDWADTGDLATVGTLPFTPEDSVDTYVVLSIRQDVTGGSGPSAADIADAVLDEALSGHTTAGTLGKAIADIESDVTAILADTGTDGVVVAAGSKTGYALSSTGLDSVTLPANLITATSIASDAITAAKIANGAIDAATFAADVDAEILSYLVDDATRIDASRLNSLSSLAILGAFSVNDGTPAVSGFVSTLTSATEDFYADMQLLFTSGDLAGVSRIITTYDGGTKAVTFDEDLPATPGNGDAFVVISLHTHTQKQISAQVWSEATRTLTANTNLNDPTAAAIADAVWDEVQSGHTTSGSFGEIATEIASILVDTGTTLQAELDGIQADTEDIQSRLPAALVSGRMDASVGAYQTGLTPLQPTTAGRTLDVTAGGCAGVDWANVEAPTTSLALTGTTIAWNSSWDAEVQSEVTDSLVAHNLDHLCLTATGSADMTSEVADNTILARILANGDTSVFDPSTDGLQPIRDQVVTVDSVVDAILVDTGTTGVVVSGTITTLDALYVSLYTARADFGITAAQVNAEVDSAIETYHLDHLLAATYDPASKPGAADALLNELIESDSGVSRFTANALEQGPSGGGSLTAQQVWEYATRTLTALDEDSTTLDLDATIRSAVGMASANLDTQLSTIDTVVDAILVDTGTDGVVVASGSKTGYSLAAAGMDSVSVETGLNARQALSIIASASAGVLAGAATTTITIAAAGVAGTNRVTATVDESGNRSSVTLSLPS